MKKLFALSSAALLLLSACQQQNQAPQNGAVECSRQHVIVSDASTQVKTSYGTIQGYLDDGIYTFKGIPYAKAERFMPPQFPDKFEGVKMCRQYGPKAPQSETLLWNDNTKTDYDFAFQFVYEPMDEKACNVLNVWTPSITDGKKRPVFVWIHGGGYFTGSGHDLPCYEGRALAEKGDIVVVNLNHRLNVLGYADLTALGGKYSESVNLGMLDIIKALEWVRDNIAEMGGDPAQVTIGGQSGGGGKVSTLLAMPQAHGLFCKAIIQSGSTLRQTEQANSQQLGLALVEALGLKPNQADKLNDFTYEELTKAASKAQEKLSLAKTMLGHRVGFGPVIDGKTLPAHPFDPVAPEISKDIPVLIGSNTNEFTFVTNVEKTLDEARETLAKTMGEQRVDSFIAAYQHVYPEGKPKDMLALDLGFRSGVVKQLDRKSTQQGAPVYAYLFDWRPTGNALGACHGMELPFMFNNIALQPEMTGCTPEAYRLAELISSAWIQFIKTGNPNTPGLPQWDAYTEENGNTMIFDNESHIVHNHDRELMQYARPLF